MTTFRSNRPRSEASTRRRKAEYWFYFTLIFCLTLPIAALLWVTALVRGDRKDARRGVLSRAVQEASATTPFIFSA